MIKHYSSQEENEERHSHEIEVEIDEKEGINDSLKEINDLIGE